MIKKKKFAYFFDVKGEGISPYSQSLVSNDSKVSFFKYVITIYIFYVIINNDVIFSIKPDIMYVIPLNNEDVLYGTYIRHSVGVPVRPLSN